MRQLIVLRHAPTRKQHGGTGSHLSPDGVRRARRLGDTLPRPEHVAVGDQPRHLETALALGFAVDEQVSWPSGYVVGEVDHHDQWSWERPFARYAELLAPATGLATVAADHLAHWRRVLDLLPDDGVGLLVTSGGTLEPVLVTALPDADHSSWGGPFHQLEGAILTWDGSAFTALELVRADRPRPARFEGRSLRDARFVDCDLSGAVMRGVAAERVELDSPWLPEGDNTLVVNGVDVVGHVEAELDRRFPGRALRRATDPDGLRTAWSALEKAWTGRLARVAAMPAGTPDVSVDGEWSFAQTLRHLVFATDAWLGRTTSGGAQPFHPLGLAGEGTDEYSLDPTVFTPGTPAYDDVLAAFESRVAQVRDFLADVTLDELSVPRTHPWDPDHQETTLACVQVILEEGWEHLRFAVRDLDVLPQR